MTSEAVPEYARLIDSNTDGRRCDVTPIFADTTAFAALTDDLIAQVRDTPFDIVAGIDALGFILGAAIALRTGTGMIPIRKAGKLPVEAPRERFVDYSGEEKGLELRRDAIWPGARVLLVDEWIETGEQVRAGIRLVEASEGKVAAVATIAADRTKRTAWLFENYAVVTALNGDP
jgi:adenine phosphoribosyltransferase